MSCPSSQFVWPCFGAAVNWRKDKHRAILVWSSRLCGYPTWRRWKHRGDRHYLYPPVDDDLAGACRAGAIGAMGQTIDLDSRNPGCADYIPVGTREKPYDAKSSGESRYIQHRQIEYPLTDLSYLEVRSRRPHFLTRFIIMSFHARVSGSMVRRLQTSASI